MSQQNAEIVTTALEAFNRRDIRALESLSQDDLAIVSTLAAAKRVRAYLDPAEALEAVGLPA